MPCDTCSAKNDAWYHLLTLQGLVTAALESAMVFGVRPLSLAGSI